MNGWPWIMREMPRLFYSRLELAGNLCPPWWRILYYWDADVASPVTSGNVQQRQSWWWWCGVISSSSWKRKNSVRKEWTDERCALVRVLGVYFRLAIIVVLNEKRRWMLERRSLSTNWFENDPINSKSRNPFSKYSLSSLLGANHSEKYFFYKTLNLVCILTNTLLRISQKWNKKRKLLLVLISFFWIAN